MYTPKCIKTKTQNLCLTLSPVDGLGLVQTLCCSTGKHGVVVVVVVVVFNILLLLLSIFCCCCCQCICCCCCQCFCCCLLYKKSRHRTCQHWWRALTEWRAHQLVGVEVAKLLLPTSNKQNSGRNKKRQLQINKVQSSGNMKRSGSFQNWRQIKHRWISRSVFPVQRKQSTHCGCFYLL